MTEKISKKFILCLFLISSFTIVFEKAKPKNQFYSDMENWAYIETENNQKTADVFFIAPTVYLGSETDLVWSEFDDATKAAFIGATNMEKGIYDDNARFFAPFYHQAALSAYSADKKTADKIFKNTYKEIKEAFEYYLENFNNGRPIVLAGFSQGAQLCIKLLEDYSTNKKFNSKFVACYAIGWRFTDEDAKKYPKVQFAQGELDTGVLIAYNSEAPGITDSLLIPEGVKTMAINPLNWKTDSTVAAASSNLGACFTNYDGKIETEIPEFTGAYVDEKRGALIVTDVDSAMYPGVLFPDGIFHIYDYMFFYRNLEMNVQNRIKSFTN